MGVLDGKVAIVTGASRGIGAQIARRFGQAGAAVAVTARTTEAGMSRFAGTISETAQQIRDAGGTAAALERFSTGLAAELYADNIAVNALSPNRVVLTPGTIFHHMTTQDDPDAESPAVMAQAALMLCSADPRALTGRVAYSQDLLAELGHGPQEGTVS